MKKSIQLVIILFLGLYFILACKKVELVDSVSSADDRYKMQVFNTDNGIDDQGNLFGSVTIIKESLEKDLHLNIFKNQNDTVWIGIPDDWIIERKEGSLFFSKLDSLSNGYFVILKYNKQDNDLSLFGYYELVQEELKSDTTELLVDLRLRDFYINSKTVYYLEGNLKRETGKYKLYSYLFERGGFIYDISLKHRGNDVLDFNREIFSLVVRSFSVSDNRPLSDPSFESIKLNVGLKE